jgi:hypothetical protein
MPLLLLAGNTGCPLKSLSRDCARYFLSSRHFLSLARVFYFQKGCFSLLMWTMSILWSLWQMAAPPTLESHTVSGQVWDVLQTRDEGILHPYLSVYNQTGGRVLIPLPQPSRPSSAKKKRGRSLTPIHQKEIKVPPSVIFADACPLPSGAQLVYLESGGLTDDRGHQWLAKDALFPFGDPEVLYGASICHTLSSNQQELRFLARDGIWIVLVGSDHEPYRLSYTHRIRMYSNRVRQGFRPMRPYDTAISLYGPHFIDVDLNGDGIDDFVVAHEDRLVIYRRDVDQKLHSKPWAEVHLADLLKTSKEADYRVHFGELDDKPGADLIVGVSQGVLPRASAAWLLSGGQDVFSRREKLWSDQDWNAPLYILNRAEKHLLVHSKVKTNMISLANAMVSKNLKAELWLWHPQAKEKHILDMELDLDGRGGKPVGALPTMEIDFEDDGFSDLVDLGEKNKAFWHRGTAFGFEKKPAAQYRLSPFSEVIAVPDANLLVLWGAPKKNGSQTRTEVQILRGR